MMYKCCHCHAIFTEPYVYTESENLDGENGRETRYVETCPWCGCEDCEKSFLRKLKSKVLFDLVESMGRRKSDISTLNVAKRLDELITDTGALKNYLGVSAQAINQYRLGIARPSLENLCKIADFYNVTTDYLLGRTSIKTIRADIAAAGKVTGLSETAITWLNSEPEEAAELSRLLQSDAFRHMIFHLSEYRICCEEKREKQEENEYLSAGGKVELALLLAQKEFLQIGEEIKKGRN